MGSGASGHVRTGRYNEHVHDVSAATSKYVARQPFVSLAAATARDDVIDHGTSLLRCLPLQDLGDTEFTIHEAMVTGDCRRLETYLLDHSEDLSVNESILQTLTLQATQSHDPVC